MSAAPLIGDEKIIVNPGAKNASIVAWNRCNDNRLYVRTNRNIRCLLLKQSLSLLQDNKAIHRSNIESRRDRIKIARRCIGGWLNAEIRVP